MKNEMAILAASIYAAAINKHPNGFKGIPDMDIIDCYKKTSTMTDEEILNCWVAMQLIDIAQ